MTDEELAVKILRELEAATVARQRQAEKQAAQHMERVSALKHELWGRLEPRVRGLAQRFHNYAEREGIGWDEFLREFVARLYGKFDKVISRYDPHRGAKVWSFLEIPLRNDFLDSIRQQAREIPPEPPVPITDEHEEKIASQEPSVTHTVEVRALGQMVDTVCWQMLQDGHPANKMMAFRLSKLWEKKQQDIAWWMGMSVGWVNGAIDDTLEEFSIAFVTTYPDITEKYECDARSPTNIESGGTKRRK